MDSKSDAWAMAQQPFMCVCLWAHVYVSYIGLIEAYVKPISKSYMGLTKAHVVGFHLLAHLKDQS